MQKQNHRYREAPSSAFTPAPRIENLCFTRWLRKVLRTDSAAYREVKQELKLQRVKTLMVRVMAPLMANMHRRDMQLYLHVLAAKHCHALRQVRFEYFDLLCRMLSEGEAMEQLLRVDAMLNE